MKTNLNKTLKEIVGNTFTIKENTKLNTNGYKISAMKNNLPNVWLDKKDLDIRNGTEYHWCSHNQKDNFNICYVPKSKLDIAIKALNHPDIVNLDCDCGYFDDTYHVCIGCTVHKALRQIGEIDGEQDEWRSILKQDAENP